MATELRPLQRLLAKRIREVESSVLEKKARAGAVWLGLKTHPRIDDRPAGDHERTSRLGGSRSSTLQRTINPSSC